MSKKKPYEDLREWVPLSKVVDYAIIDDWDDAQVNRQRFNNWAIRGYRKLNLNLLRYVQNVLIPIDPKTGTGHLPDNYRKAISAGYYDLCGMYTDIMQVGMIDVMKEKKCNCGCDVCGCSADSFCDSVSYETTEEIVNIAGNPYTNVTVRRFDKKTATYMEQKDEWIYVAKTDKVEKRTTVSSLCTLETKPCGCVAETPENVQQLKNCGCCGVWEYYGRNNYCNDDYFSIDEENGLIHIGMSDVRYVRLKYYAHLPMKNGEVMIPAVAIETLAAWILFKRDNRRRSLGLGEKDRSYLNYKRERSELRKNIFPIRMSVIENALNLVPHS